MISFDLRCGQDHVFEGWFASNGDFERQNEQGLVTCPLCEDARITKAPMAPNVAAKGNRGSQATQELTPMQVMGMLRQLKRHIEKNADDVGESFAEEARKIHYGEVAPRGIYGRSTPEESEELLEEGIAFMQLPWVQDTDH
ncbi:MAG: DUF1178 family protein [Minwuia sp.]|uniref:DUF1178 family protein n=1 Tax=Minwuia sp. TaxID=2493630 RepID=UPI003A8BD82D